jgi:hypothetical protein
MLDMPRAVEGVRGAISLAESSRKNKMKTPRPMSCITLHYIALSELNSYNAILPHSTVSHRIAATPYASYDEGPEA